MMNMHAFEHKEAENNTFKKPYGHITYLKA